MTQLLNRDMLFGKAVEQFELTINKDNKPTDTIKTIRDISLEDVVKHTQTVSADDSLITAKVVDSVVRGAEEDENLWRQCANVVTMSGEIVRTPLITPDDFKVYPWIERTKARQSGGSFWSVKLDCSQSAGLYATDIGFTRNDLKAGGYAKMEEALFCAGQAIGRLILQKINTKLLADVNAAMTDTLANWGANHYKALKMMESLIQAQGMKPDVALVNPTEGYDLGILDYFIRADYVAAGRATQGDLHSVGFLHNTLPIFQHRDITTASMIMLAKKAITVGIYRDVTIENYEDVREGLEGAIASVQFDVKSGKDAEGPKDATSPLIKSWAVTTVA